MTNNIHETAIVASGAKLGADVKIGPYCVVGENVVLGDRVELKSHVVVEGRTTVGEETVIFPFASIGHPPQDLKFKGEESELIIGKRNKIREHVTMNPGTADDSMKTIVGDDCLFMMGSHVAHDCMVGNQVILANNATLAGHVHVGDFVILGGLSAVHQFVRIGSHAFIGGMSGVEHDVIPYGMVKGDRAYLAGLNYVGLERRGFDKDQVQILLKVFRQLFKGEGTLADRMHAVADEHANDDFVMTMVNFINSRENRALCLPRTG
ncbi:MAG: acyl-ACP--UDP-N-acetylglucosamine O-acyltransferase [Alphaproteobacteria bacterium]|nr:MAG: acyl-ACP--UDP-N-acetylglucosamine O-acyltransferase [Alphaproteobacteria bacterium]